MSEPITAPMKQLSTLKLIKDLLLEYLLKQWADLMLFLSGDNIVIDKGTLFPGGDKC
ncbi:hypothetical protein M3226_21310 [Neobacillus cucumis]|uniref:hypothetical protein n=1 Tax=Neobacillus cucumis TaxID=1740721 RepID=UPI00203B9E8A|nr:hypothetical protein [Neobacillus cucumis]MCM3728192.1 hypothetical protein [Neobacillus cucumis]